MKIFKAIFLSALLVCTGQAFSQVCLNIPNTKKTSYTLLSGGTMTNQAEGKAKILVFFQVNDAKSREVAKNITSSYSSLASSVDICFVETKRSSKALVTKFRDTYASSSVNIAYDSTTASAISMQEYMKVLFGKAASIANPLVVYIDKNNVIRHEDHGKKLTFANIKETLADCMDIKLGSSSGIAQTPSTPQTQQKVYGPAKYKGKDLVNTKTYDYTLLDGTKVTNQANGKPKVLIYYATWCGWCKVLSKAIAADYQKFSDVDIYEVNMDKASDDKIQKYITETSAGKLKFTKGDSLAYDSFREYVTLLNTSGGVPKIIFIDCNNKVQYLIPGCPQGDTAGAVRNAIDNYLIPKEGL
ncbi:MAG: redoxin domain-containing protein [Treponema sp.]|nr:redoxin domain-containing protein [Treponema sp.]